MQLRIMFDRQDNKRYFIQRFGLYYQSKLFVDSLQSKVRLISQPHSSSGWDVYECSVSEVQTSRLQRRTNPKMYKRKKCLLTEEKMYTCAMRFTYSSISSWLQRTWCWPFTEFTLTLQVKHGVPDILFSFFLICNFCQQKHQ